MVIAAVLMFLVLLVAWFLAPNATKSQADTPSVDEPGAAVYQPQRAI